MIEGVADAELLALALGLTLLLGYYLGRYLVHLIRGTPRPFEGFLSKAENLVFRAAGIDPKRSMDWKEYVIALVLLDAAFAIFTYVVLGLQGWLPGNPRGLLPFSWDLNFNTSASFITNTNLQHYSGDQALTVASQLVLMLNQYVAPASAIAVGLAFLRPFIQKGKGIGNFYADFFRSLVTILLPISFVSALLLMAVGVPQTLNGTLTTGLIGGGHQTFVVGPLAGFDSIMELGQNGGGYYGANLGSPFANPNGISDLVYLILMLIIPLAFIFAYGELVGRGRGRAFMVAVLAPFVALLAYSLTTVSGPVGLETRFGGFGSVLFQFFSISSDTGSTNAYLSGLSPRTGASLFTFMFVQAIPGGPASGS